MVSYSDLRGNFARITSNLQVSNYSSVTYCSAETSVIIVHYSENINRQNNTLIVDSFELLFLKIFKQAKIIDHFSRRTMIYVSQFWTRVRSLRNLFQFQRKITSVNKVEWNRFRTYFSISKSLHKFKDVVLIESNTYFILAKRDSNIKNLSLRARLKWL